MTQPSLKIKTQLPFTPREIFDAWSKPKIIEQWLRPKPNWTATCSNDFKVGGTINLKMTTDDGSSYPHIGKYIEIIPDQKIVLTWSGKELQDTLITLELKMLAGETELTLSHELFPKEEFRDTYHTGWQVCLENLAKVLEGQQGSRK